MTAMDVADVVMWVLRLLAGLLGVATVLPFVRHGSWVVRGWDFPRLQLAAAAAGVGALMLGVAAWIDSRRDGDWPRDIGLWLALLVAIALWQAGHVLRYTRLWPKQVSPIGGRAPGRGPTRADPPDSGVLRLLTTNLDMRNQQYDAVAGVLRRLDPDVLLLIEIHDRWSEALDELRASYPHRIEHIVGEGLGIALWSRRELRNPELRFLVSRERASIHAELSLGGDRWAFLMGVHPVPPGLRTGRWYERYDSRIRDAELLKLGEVVAEHPDRAWLIAGDFNDVAWSRSTRRFERVSGLADPRVGRKLLNTYHARLPLLRYPLDHVYVSPAFQTGRLERVVMPGSDHFAVLAELWLPPGEEPERSHNGADPDADGEEHRDAAAIIREGHEDAVERGDR